MNQMLVSLTVPGGEFLHSYHGSHVDVLGPLNNVARIMRDGVARYPRAEGIRTPLNMTLLARASVSDGWRLCENAEHGGLRETLIHGQGRFDSDLASLAAA